MFSWRSYFTPLEPALQAGNLMLRPFHRGDANAFCQQINMLVHSPEIQGAMLTFPKPFQIHHARRRILETHKWIKSNRGWSLAIVYQGEMIGQAQIICAQPHSRRAEIAYWIGPEFQGLGLAKRAMTCLLNAAVSHWPLEQLEATVVPGNTASIGLLHRLGFTYCELASVPYRRQGDWRRQTADLEIYTRPAKWPKV